MNPAQGWFGELLARRPVITDGAWGTELQAAGLPLGAFPEAWNLSRPERVLAVAHAYVAAGSRVILTNTFSANRIRLAETDLVSRVAEINREGVRISREAAAGQARVFASIGPTG
ncbi:MAG: homocysteine S-methyltransferase family protein, partial [Verrucomicrobiales bacterium]|nr:homocysteine S-methyltransferase family protein [Verrucomicrobiales bacterium]